MSSILNGLKKYPFHCILVILFFLSHGYSEYYGLIRIHDLLVYFLIAAAITVVSFLVLKIVFKSSIKTGIFITILLIIYLFFGVFIDLFKETRLTQSIARYRFVFIIFLILIIIAFIFIKRSRKKFIRLNLYLNIVFIVLICVDLVTIFIFYSGGTRTKDLTIKSLFDSKLTKCDSCNKPDIYFILLDEYSGTSVLKKQLNYDNKPFEDSLTKRGFRMISNARSNYPFTAMSLASTLNMSYISYSGVINLQAKHFSDIFSLIRNNIVTNYLKKNNYKFFNYSIFDIDEQPSIFQQNFFPTNIRLILDKTFPERSKKDLFIDRIIGPFHFQWGIKAEMEKIARSNAAVMHSMLEVSKENKSQPKFVYTHLLMPHDPYRFDSSGRQLNIKTSAIPRELQSQYYLSYLIYTNKVVLNLVYELQMNSNGRAVIILMGDHAFRSFYPEIPIENLFPTLNAIYLPDRQYDHFYDGLTNVNEFRILFNQLFDQKMPLLKDSLIYIPF